MKRRFAYGESGKAEKRESLLYILLLQLYVVDPYAYTYCVHKIQGSGKEVAFFPNCCSFRVHLIGEN